MDRIKAQTVGAKFFRADLHVHSFGGSHDVSDETMTPESIVQKASEERLSILAIADHNEIRNVVRAIEAAKGRILVIPAIELSTLQGHLLCYFETLLQLQKFYGALTLVDAGTSNSRCAEGMHQCLDLAKRFDGFCVLAHVDGPAGFESVVPGGSPHKADILRHPALLGIELKTAASKISYGVDDPDATRAALGANRVEPFNESKRRPLARVLNSDAHSLVHLGRNAANDQKLTRFKMENPSYLALRIALEDADARVRIEDLVPVSIPRILGLHMEGGFLAGQSMRFSSNLNCIIGGRGTGKSTAFEAVRCLIERTEKANEIVDSDAWPDELHLVMRDKAGQTHHLFRLKEQETENVENPDTGPTTFEIDCFGQGDAHKISMQAQSNPLALLHYLDRFTAVGEAIAEETGIRIRLLELQEEIEKADAHVAQIAANDRFLASTQKQLAAMQKPEVKALIELNRQLATEKTLRAQVVALVGQVKREATSLTCLATAKAIRALADPTTLAVGKDEFLAIDAGAVVLENSLVNAESGIKANVATFSATVGEKIQVWKTKEGDAQQRIDAKRRELEALKVDFDMAYIGKLVKDEATHKARIAHLKTFVPILSAKRKERSDALQARWIARARVAGLRDAFARQATATLRAALTDLNVSLKYAPNAYSSEASELIIGAMGWKTVAQLRVLPLIRDLTVPRLLEVITKGDPKPLTELKNSEGESAFRMDEARTLIERLAVPALKSQLERVALYDLPLLTVTRRVVDEKGLETFVKRDFAKLSLGQQQSVLLALMLSASSDRPLIIDQPEDNLDGEFIFATLVPVLRQAKERRQVIIVTHNANVAVLGDAEQIVVLKATNGRGAIASRGSIDHGETRDLACAILEGAKEALARRAKMYGLGELVRS